MEHCTHQTGKKTIKFRPVEHATLCIVCVPFVQRNDGSGGAKSIEVIFISQNAL